MSFAGLRGFIVLISVYIRSRYYDEGLIVLIQLAQCCNNIPILLSIFLYNSDVSS